MKRLLSTFLCMILSWPVLSQAENYIVRGDMGSNIRYELQEQVTAGGGIQKIVLSFAVPQSFQSPTSRQEIKEFGLAFSPEPQERKSNTDGRGNQITVTVSREVSLSTGSIPTVNQSVI